MNNKGKIAVLQIMILILGIVAFSGLMGIFNTGFVSARVGDACRDSEDCGSGEIYNVREGKCIQDTPPGLDFGNFAQIGPTVLNLANKKTTTPKPASNPLGDNWKEIPSDAEPLGGLKTALSDEKLDGTPPTRVTAKDLAAGKTGQSFAAKGGWAAIGKSFVWAVGAGLIVRMVAPMFGANEKQANVLALSIGTGMFAGQALHQLTSKEIIKNSLLTKPGMQIGVGVGVAAIMILAFYPIEGKKVVSYDCKKWQAPSGGKRCEECNDLYGLPCSEYMCRSLGQSCELLNPGTTEEKCAWVNPRDVKPPIISTYTNSLLENYSYSPDSAINPPDKGVRIIAPTTDECVPAFTPLQFGVLTDEPAICKISKYRQREFNEITSYMGDSLYLYNHTQIMPLPGLKNAEQENITLENNGEFELFVKCQDRNGNSNEANFVFKFCVQKEADTTPPLIVDTSVINNMPVAKGQDSIDMAVYVNEPAECKWSTMNKDYDSMENIMDCTNGDSLSDAIEFNSRLVYTCETILTGIKDKQDNLFYFRCKDQPSAVDSDRNVNSESYELNLIGTRELVIDEAGPSGEIRDSTEAVKVTLTAKTSAGYKEGEAICLYKDINGDSEEFIEFFNTNSYSHSTDLYLAEEEYQFLIRCVDLGGNSDEYQVNFTVESDADSPIITRIFKDNNYLKITTDEKANCVYDTSSCNYLFEDGIALSSGDQENTNTLEWETQNNFYIKCQDEFGNEPSPNQCSAIIRAF